MKLETVWIVTNPTPISELVDICYECNVSRLPALIFGTGSARWESEGTTLYTDKAEAVRDAELRLRLLPGIMKVLGEPKKP